MATLQLTAKQDALFQAIGAKAYMRAKTMADRGTLAEVAWHEHERRAAAIVPGNPPATVTAVWRPDTATIDGNCSCRRSASCVHRAALILLTIDHQPEADSTVAANLPPPPVWEREIDAWLNVPTSAPASRGVPVGL